MGIVGIEKLFKSTKLDEIIERASEGRRKREEELRTERTEPRDEVTHKTCARPRSRLVAELGRGADVADRGLCFRPARGAAVRVRNAGSQSAVPAVTGC